MIDPNRVRRNIISRQYLLAFFRCTDRRINLFISKISHCPDCILPRYPFYPAGNPPTSSSIFYRSVAGPQGHGLPADCIPVAFAMFENIYTDNRPSGQVNEYADSASKSSNTFAQRNLFDNNCKITITDCDDYDGTDSLWKRVQSYGKNCRRR